MAEDERKRIRDRQEEGIKIALENGVKFGRRKIAPSRNFKEVYDVWKSGKITAVRAMKMVNLKSNTFYRRVKEHEFNLNKWLVLEDYKKIIIDFSVYVRYNVHILKWGVDLYDKH